MNCWRTIFTALHWIQGGLVTIMLSVLPSVRQTRDLWQNKSANILIPRERSFIPVLWQEQWVVGDDSFCLKFWVKLTQLERKRRFSIDIRSSFIWWNSTILTCTLYAVTIMLCDWLYCMTIVLGCWQVCSALFPARTALSRSTYDWSLSTFHHKRFHSSWFLYLFQSGVLLTRHTKTQPVPGDIIQGIIPKKKSNFFAAEFTKNTGQTITWKAGGWEWWRWLNSTI